MNEEIIKMAAEALQISIEDAKKNYKTIPEIDAYYFWNPIRGGYAVIIDTRFERLIAGSSVSLETHKEAFRKGKRN